MWLVSKLKEYIEEIQKARTVLRYLDGNFVMAESTSRRHSLILVMPDGWDFAGALKPFEYNIASKGVVGRNRF